MSPGEPTGIGRIPDRGMSAAEIREEAVAQADEVDILDEKRAEQIDRVQAENAVGAVGVRNERSAQIDRDLQSMENKLKDFINHFDDVYEQDRQQRMNESYGRGIIGEFNKRFSGADQKNVATEGYSWQTELKKKFKKALFKTGITGTLGLGMAAVIGGATLPASLGVIGVGVGAGLVGRMGVEAIRIWRGKERRQREEVERSHYGFLQDLRVMAAGVIQSGEELIRTHQDEENYNVFTDNEYISKLTNVYTLLYDHSKRNVVRIMVPAESDRPEDVDREIQEIQTEMGRPLVSGQTKEAFRMAKEGEEGAVNIKEREEDLRRTEKISEKVSDWVSLATSLGASLAAKFLYGTQKAVEVAGQHAKTIKDALDAGKEIRNVNFADYSGQHFSHNIQKGTDGIVYYAKEFSKQLVGSKEDLGAEAGKRIWHTVGLSYDKVAQMLQNGEAVKWTTMSAKQLYMIAAWGMSQLATNIGSWYANHRLEKADKAESERIVAGQLEWVKTTFERAQERERNAERDSDDSEDGSLSGETLDLTDENIFRYGYVIEIQNPDDVSWEEMTEFKEKFLASGVKRFVIVRPLRQIDDYQAVWLSPVGPDGQNADEAIPIDGQFLLQHKELYSVTNVRRKATDRSGADDNTGGEEEVGVSTNLEDIIQKAVEQKKLTPELLRQVKLWAVKYVDNNINDFENDFNRKTIYSNEQLIIEAECKAEIISFYITGPLVDEECSFKIEIGQAEEDGAGQTATGDVKKGETADPTVGGGENIGDPAVGADADGKEAGDAAEPQPEAITSDGIPLVEGYEELMTGRLKRLLKQNIENVLAREPDLGKPETVVEIKNDIRRAEAYFYVLAKRIDTAQLSEKELLKIDTGSTKFTLNFWINQGKIAFGVDQVSDTGNERTVLTGSEVEGKYHLRFWQPGMAFLDLEEAILKQDELMGLEQSKIVVPPGQEFNPDPKQAGEPIKVDDLEISNLAKVLEALAPKWAVSEAVDKRDGELLKDSFVNFLNQNSIELRKIQPDQEVGKVFVFSNVQVKFMIGREKNGRLYANIISVNESNQIQNWLMWTSKDGEFTYQP